MPSRLKRADDKVAGEIGPKPSKNGKPKPPGASQPTPESQPQVVDVAVDQIAGIADLKRLGSMVRWLWPGWIQQGVVAGVAGQPGDGKTRLMADLVRRMRHRLPWPDGQPMNIEEDPRVLWIPADNHHDELVTLTEKFAIEDCIKFNADKKEPYGGTTLESPDDFDRLESRVRAYKPHLIFIDTVGNSTSLNLTLPEDAKAYYQPLQVIARKYSSCLVAMTHVNAAGQFLGRRVLEKVRTAIRVHKPDPSDERRALEVVKSNSKRPKPIGITMSEKGAEYDHQPPQAPLQMDSSFAGGGMPSSRVQECADWLKKRLAPGRDGVARIRSDCEAAGFNANLMYKAKDVLGVIQDDSKRPFTWCLPDDALPNDVAFR